MLSLSYYEEFHVLTNDKEIRIFNHYYESTEDYTFNTYCCDRLEFTCNIIDEVDEALEEYLPDLVHLNPEDCASFFKDAQSKKIKDALKICRVNPSDVDKFLHLSVVYNRITEKIGVYIETIDKEGRHLIKPEYIYSQEQDEEAVLIRLMLAEFLDNAADKDVFIDLPKNFKVDEEISFEEILEI